MTRWRGKVTPCFEESTLKSKTTKYTGAERQEKNPCISALPNSGKSAQKRQGRKKGKEEQEIGVKIQMEAEKDSPN